jgi:hypothetical protein
MRLSGSRGMEKFGEVVCKEVANMERGLPAARNKLSMICAVGKGDGVWYRRRSKPPRLGCAIMIQ